jgi:hypothetical protein
MTRSYDEHRDCENLRLLEDAIGDFVSHCQHRPPSSSTSPRQTVFFFPGGMASRLTCATTKFDPSNPQQYDYDPIWVIPRTFVGGAPDLAMYRDGAGTFRDKNDRFIIADAPVSFLGITPHDRLIKWCKGQNADLFVFPWDWRRRMEDTSRFFIGKFLPFFRCRVMKGGCPDPLERFALIGHSAGGMIANLILRSGDPILDNVTHVITVGTPFYGYAGHLHRWFEGVSELNDFNRFKQSMMETVASLPGPYVYNFLDEDTFNSIHKPLLSDDEFPLLDYPSMDATNASLRADPYNPKTNGDKIRYPATTGFSRDELDYAKKQFQQLASPMDPGLLTKFHNIRGVRTKASGKPHCNTIGGITWAWIDATFNAHDATPIKNDSPLVPGDDTQPAYTARLAANMPRCFTAKATDIEHVCLMNHDQVLMEIQQILCPKDAGMELPKATPPLKPVSDKEVADFLEWMTRHWLDIRDLTTLEALEEKAGKRFDLLAIARRILADLMRGTGPQALDESDGSADEGLHA